MKGALEQGAVSFVRAPHDGRAGGTDIATNPFATGFAL